MSDNKPFMDIESDFDPDLVYVVRKYSIEETKWQMDNGGRDILEKYPDLEHWYTNDVVETWKKLETGINPLAELLTLINEKVLPELGTLVLEQSSKKAEQIERAQAYLDLANVLETMLSKYTPSKDAVVGFYSRLAETAVNLAGEPTVYKELEKKEFRYSVFRNVFPTLDKALEEARDIWEKSDQASDAYVTYLLFLKTNPVISSEVNLAELEKESLGRRKSLAQEQKRFAEKNIRKMYENE